jgi:hypothetical protein
MPRGFRQVRPIRQPSLMRTRVYPTPSETGVAVWHVRHADASSDIIVGTVQVVLGSNEAGGMALQCDPDRVLFPLRRATYALVRSRRSSTHPVQPLEQST